jgi:DnaJ-class molecular chaperone
VFLRCTNGLLLNTSFYIVRLVQVMGDLDPELDQDHYAVLRLDRTATSASIKRAYKDLQRYVKNETERLELHLAYSVLVNPSRRVMYDRVQDKRAEFNLFFANEMIKKHNETETIVRKQGVHHYADLQVTLEEAFTGINKEHIVTVVKPCWECYGICAKCRGCGAVTGFVLMPTGVQHRTNSKCGACNGKGFAKHKTTVVSAPVTAVVNNGVADPMCNDKVYVPIEELIKEEVGADANEKVEVEVEKAVEVDKEKEEEAVDKLNEKSNDNKIANENCNEQANTLCKTCKSLEDLPVIIETVIVNVKVPVGADSGMTFTFPGLGEQIPHGIHGDLIVRLIVDPSSDTRITRHGEHLKAKLSIPFINTITGRNYDIVLPSGEIMHFHTSIFEEVLNPGRIYIIKEKGMQKTSGIRGSLLVHFDVDYAACKLPLVKRSEDAMNALEKAWGTMIAQ